MGSHNIIKHRPQTLAPPPPPFPSSSQTSFPILAISIVGILATAILLLSYYVFVIKCCLNRHHADVLRRISRSRRRWGDLDSRFFSPSADGALRVGLSESAIRAIPTLKFRRPEQQNSFHDCCSVCLNEFEEEERIRMLPSCFHLFHIDCIDTWLQTHANCPLCRAEITSTGVLDQLDVVFDVRDVEDSEQTPRTAATAMATTAAAAFADSTARDSGRKSNKILSMGDECIDLRGKDEQFGVVQPMRRSFSMGSSSDRQLYTAVQEILRQNPHFRDAAAGIYIGGEGSTSAGSGRSRRPFFSFGGHCRSSRSAVLPIQNEYPFF